MKILLLFHFIHRGPRKNIKLLSQRFCETPSQPGSSMASDKIVLFLIVIKILPHSSFGFKQKKTNMDIISL